MISDRTEGTRAAVTRRLVLLVAALAQLGTLGRAAPLPAQLVVQVHSGHHGQGAGGIHHWQEFPVALNPANVSSFKPILPGTDHGLYNEGFFEGDILRTRHHPDPNEPDTKNAVTDPNLLWPSGAVVYKVDDDVGCPESPQCAILMSAMDHYHQQTCIRFKQWTGEDNWVTIFFNSDSSGACWSPVGRVGDGEQRLSLGERCWYRGIVIHELGHAIGFWHEMNRPDRDDWIYVYWQNIIPGFASAFRKHTTVATLGEHFDYRSIMMYDEYAFSKDGRSPTLQATTGEEIGPIWKKPGLSASDKRRIEKLYKCDPKKPKYGFPYDVNCDFNKHVCGFKNGGSPNWSWRTVNQTDGYVYTSFDTAGTTPGHFMSINFPPISNAMESVRGELGCVRFYYLIETDGEAQLTLDQAYLRKVTQLSHDQATTFELWSNDTSSNEWIHMEIPLYVTRPFKLIFSSTFNGSASHGIIALDDVELLYTPCNPTASTTTTTTTTTTTAATTTTDGSEETTTTVTPSQTMPSSPKPRPPRPPRPSKPARPTPSSTTPATTTPEEVESEDTSLSSLTGLSSTGQPSSTSEPPTTTTPQSVMTTAQTEEAIQQMQLQQQQTILQAQQLLEQQQQKEQKQQLLAMSQNLQQHVDQHSAAQQQHKHHSTARPATPQTTPQTTQATPLVTPAPDMTSTTFPSYQTVSVTEATSTDGFPVTLPSKVPNLPMPADQMSMENPRPRPTTPTATSGSGPSGADNYDVDESQQGR